MGIFIAFLLQFIAVFFLIFLFEGNKVGLSPKIVQAGILSLLLLGIGFISGIFGFVGIIFGWLATLAAIKGLLRYEIGGALLFLFCLGIVNQLTALVVGNLM